jgi:hypothetical protein
MSIMYKSYKSRCPVDKKNNQVISCSTCKHRNKKLTEEPCYSCVYGACFENLNRTNRWENKNE